MLLNLRAKEEKAMKVEKEYATLVDRVPGEGVLIEVPELPGLICQEKTLNAAWKELLILMEEWIEVASSMGRTIPVPTMPPLRYRDFDCGDEVLFYIKKEGRWQKKRGTIEIVDAYGGGAWWQECPSADILVEPENTIYKHIPWPNLRKLNYEKQKELYAELEVSKQQIVEGKIADAKEALCKVKEKYRKYL
jgi:predicted RNase H-like HicB family nuclease